MFHHIRSLSYNYQIRIRGRREGESGIIGMMTVMRCLIRFGNPAAEKAAGIVRIHIICPDLFSIGRLLLFLHGFMHPFHILP